MRLQPFIFIVIPTEYSHYGYYMTMSAFCQQALAVPPLSRALNSLPLFSKGGEGRFAYERKSPSFPFFKGGCYSEMQPILCTP
jgi:hypothetical protein